MTTGPKDPLGWARKPRSAVAIATVQELSTRDRRFRAIWARLLEIGVVTEKGLPLQIWSGTEWQAVSHG